MEAILSLENTSIHVFKLVHEDYITRLNTWVLESIKIQLKKGGKCQNVNSVE